MENLLLQICIRLKMLIYRKIKLQNYYDNNNLINIPLDSKYSPSINAKKFFKKYTKLKTHQKLFPFRKKKL